LLAVERGNPAGAANRGRLFFGYFLLARQKKVTSCRATPGGFDLGFAFDVGLRGETANPTYALHPSTGSGRTEFIEAI